MSPEITYKPSLRGEVTHYVADISKAREKLGWEPKTPLDAGIPARRRVVQRMARGAPGREPRDRPGARTGRDRARLQEFDVIALYGPTASGKSAVAGLLRERLGGEVVSADSAALYAGIPILTAAPSYPARLVGVVPLDARRLGRRVPAPRARGDRRDPRERARHRSSRAAPGSISAPHFPGSSFRRRRLRARASGGGRSTTRSAPSGHTPSLRSSTPPRRRRFIRTTVGA